MYRTALKNFVNNIVYLFVPMGIFYLFLLISLFLLFYGFIGQTGDMLAAVMDLVKTASAQSSADVSSFFKFAYAEIDWNGNLLDTIHQILDTGWLSSTVTGFFESISLSTEGFDENIGAVLADYSGAVSMYLSLCVSLVSLGVTLANFMTGWLVRRNTARRNFKKVLIAHTVVPLVQSAVIIVSVLLLSSIQYYSLLVFAAMLIISCAFSLASSWIVHGKGKIALKEVVTPKNIAKHLSILLLLIVLNFIVALLLFLISPLLCFLLMIPVIIYSLVIGDVNTDSYVLFLIGEKGPSLLPAAPAAKAPAMPETDPKETSDENESPPTAE